MECLRCKDPNKTRSDFGKTSRGNLKKRCNSCCTEAVRKIYAESVEYRQSCKDGRKRRSLAIHRKILAYLLENPCVDCGEKDPLVLQFDHKTDKKFCVTGMSLNCWDTVLIEIAKCDVRCANCHARRTAKQFNTIRYKLTTNDANN